MKKYIFSLSLIILLIPFLAFSQSKFYFDTDYTIFKNADSTSIVEFYFAFSQRYLKYVKVQDGFEAMANLEVNIFDKDKEKIVFNDIYGLQSKVTDSAKSKLTSKLIGQQNFKLGAGKYLFTLIGLDYNDKSKCDTLRFDINLNVYDPLKSYLSGLQIGSSIEKSTEKKSIFYKNGLEITPNPNLLFGMNLNTIWYYIEIYSLNKEFISDSVFLVSSIEDISNNVLMQKSKKVKSNAGAFADVGSFITDTLEKGSYFLNVELIDKVNQLSIKKQKKFFIYNASKNETTTQNDGQDFLRSEYVTMKEDRLNEEYDKTIYIRTQTETDDYKKLSSVDEKRKFMYNFWKKRDDNPVTPQNEFKIKYFVSLNDANKLFKQGFTEGWKTDRGRIYITYGKPSDVESFPYESDTKGYEIWHYEALQGGTICVFVELQPGSGFYVLEHSTIRTELKNENWKDRLRKI